MKMSRVMSVMSMVEQSKTGHHSQVRNTHATLHATLQAPMAPHVRRGEVCEGVGTISMWVSEATTSDSRGSKPRVCEGGRAGL